MLVALRVLAAAILASGAGFGIHVLYGRGWARDYVDTAARSGRLDGILREPYPAAIVVLAAFTALLPALGKVLAYLLLQSRLPGRSGWQRGLSFGVLSLLMSDAFLRLPAMNIAVGNPVDVALVQSAEAWVISLVTGVLIGVAAPAHLGRLCASKTSA